MPCFVIDDARSVHDKKAKNKLTGLKWHLWLRKVCTCTLWTFRKKPVRPRHKP